MSSSSTYQDLERPLLAGEEEEEQIFRSYMEEEDTNGDANDVDLAVKTNNNNNNNNSGYFDGMVPICSWAAFFSVATGFVVQMVVFLSLDAYMGHPPSIMITLPISIMISVTLLSLVCSIPHRYIQSVVNIVTSWTFITGMTLGFLVQVVSLGSTAAMAWKYGSKSTGTTDTINFHDDNDKIIYYALLVLSQSWWILFPIICLAIDGGITGSERSLFGRIFFTTGNNSSDVTTAATRREVFLGGVRFHVGIVVGCFMVWSLIDVVFRASASVLVTLAVSFVACLALCYGMICIHDRYMAEAEAELTKNNKDVDIIKPSYIDGLLVV